MDEWTRFSLQGVNAFNYLGVVYNIKWRDAWDARENGLRRQSDGSNQNSIEIDGDIHKNKIKCLENRDETCNIIWKWAMVVKQKM